MDAGNSAQAHCWRGASCTASVPPHSTSTGNTSKKMPRWSGASSRLWSAEPSVEDAIAILRGLEERYEVYPRRQRFTDRCPHRRSNALRDRYITDRFLPDKAIDLVHEACAHGANRRSTPCPPSLDEKPPPDHPARDRGSGALEKETMIRFPRARLQELQKETGRAARGVQRHERPSWDNEKQRHLPKCRSCGKSWKPTNGAISQAEKPGGNTNPYWAAELQYGKILLP